MELGSVYTKKTIYSLCEHLPTSSVILMGMHRNYEYFNIDSVHCYIGIKE